MTIYLFISLAARSQGQFGSENYWYAAKDGSGGYSTRCWYEAASGWYAEGRYNYDAAHTASVYAGKTLSKTGRFNWTLTPCVGLLGGVHQGYSTGLNAELDYGKLSFSTASQYTVASGGQPNPFFYSWSEIAYTFRGPAYAGLALQQTFCGEESRLEPGLMLGLTNNHFNPTIYIFRRGRQDLYLEAGFNMQWKGRGGHHDSKTKPRN